MANHVSAYLQVQSISEEGQKVWDEYVQGTLDKNVRDLHEAHLGHFIFDCDEEGEFTNWDFNTMCEEIGAKWAYATDWGEDFVNTYSAWSPVLDWAELVARKIGEVDPDVELVLTYEDEFPNFVGVATFTAEGMVADNSIESDELLELIMDDNPELREMYDEDECTWKEGKEDEAHDILMDVQWDKINEWQENNVEWSR